MDDMITCFLSHSPSLVREFNCIKLSRSCGILFSSVNHAFESLNLRIVFRGPVATPQTGVTDWLAKSHRTDEQKGRVEVWTALSPVNALSYRPHHFLCPEGIFNCK